MVQWTEDYVNVTLMHVAYPLPTDHLLTHIHSMESANLKHEDMRLFDVR
jgi:hypothetical protein